jgi:hypothetical protein
MSYNGVSQGHLPKTSQIGSCIGAARTLGKRVDWQMREIISTWVGSLLGAEVDGGLVY